MSIPTVKVAVIDALETIANMGIVEGESGRVEGLPWEDKTSPLVLPLWVVTLGPSEMTSRTIGVKSFTHTWEIRGYYPHNFEGHSQETWEAYLQAVVSLFKKDPAITVCTQTVPPRIVSGSEFVQYKSKMGSVLCHYSLIEFRTTEAVRI